MTQVATVVVGGGEVVLHHGDPLAEYRSVRDSAGVAVREDRARIRLWGKDPVRMVQGLITNDLAGAAPGRGVYAAILNPKGRVIGDVRAFHLHRGDGTEVLLELSREALEGVAGHLRKFVPPMFAKWADASDAIRQVGVYGPRAREVVSAAVGEEIPELEEDGMLEVAVQGAPVLIVGTREIGLESGYDLFLPSEMVTGVEGALLGAAGRAGGRRVGFAALETLRMEAGRPRYGAELSEEVIATEAFEAVGLMERAISFGKGCYTGQEVIVRIAHRGHVNRHLRGLRMGDAEPPEARASIINPENGREVGRITGATRSPALGETIALGYLRREMQPGAVVRVGGLEGPEARVTELPLVTRG